MSGFVVVDASVAIKWLVREEHTDKALSILRAWHEEEVTPAAPHLLPFEVANALHRKGVSWPVERRGHRSHDVAAAQLSA